MNSKFSSQFSMQRRTAIKLSALAPAALGTGMLGGLVRSAYAQNTAAPADYKALVAVFMFGGNDGNNLLIPLDAAGFADYTSGRGALALPRAQLTALSPTNTGGRQFALHPSMGALSQLFTSGQCAAIANVGPLVQPTTRAQWQGDSALSPPNLFSHSDQQSQWQSGAADTAVKLGWGGRVADQIASLNGAQNIATAVAVNGRSFFQQGASVSPFSVSPNGSFGFDAYDPSDTNDPLSVAFGEMINAPRSHLFDAAWNDVIKRGINTQQVFQNALNNAAPLATVFPNTGLADQLKTVARLIAARGALGVKRQVYFCSIGGFDTHGEDQLVDQAELLGNVSEAMAAFYRATVELNVAQQVTTFTMSDFGRDFPANGNGGSDHGWGSHHLIVGGAVQGNKLYGSFPTLRVNGPDDTSGGRWIPTTATEQYAATLARWFGLSGAEITATFPTLSRFPGGMLSFV
jgi:uncharacterized protein (DUF1501 family)